MGHKQGIWPFTFRDGRLIFRVRFGHGDYPDVGSPLVYATHYNSDNGGGRQVRSGRYCGSYTITDGYLVSIKNPKKVYWDMPIAKHANLTGFNEHFMSVEGEIETDVARSLSGKLATYITLDNITGTSYRRIADGGYQMDGDNNYCYGGTHAYVNGRIYTMRIVNKETGVTILSLAFGN